MFNTAVIRRGSKLYFLYNLHSGDCRRYCVTGKQLGAGDHPKPTTSVFTISRLTCIIQRSKAPRGDIRIWENFTIWADLFMLGRLVWNFCGGRRRSFQLWCGCRNLQREIPESWCSYSSFSLHFSFFVFIFFCSYCDEWTRSAVSLTATTFSRLTPPWTPTHVTLLFRA